jgi:hypothetical protein
VLLVEALFFKGFDLSETLRYVNRELVANGQRQVAERTIDIDRSRMRELWREWGWAPLWWPPRAVYQPRRTTKPMDAYMPPPSLAPAEPTPAPPGPKIQRFEDLLAQDLEEEAEPW